MKKSLWILFYCLIFSLLIYNSFSYLDPDFGWHLRFGEIIAQTKSLPHDQIFMWTLENKTWVDHEWLANLVIYVIWSVGGYITLSLIFALLPTLTLYIINRHLFKYYSFNNLGVIVLAIIELLLILTASGHLGIRVQEVTLLAIALLIIKLDQNNFSEKKTPPWWLPLFFYGWACLHGGFLFGLVLLCMWTGLQIIFYYLPKFRPKNIAPLPKPVLTQWVIISLLSFFITFITPYGFSLYSFLSDYGDTFYMSHIREWQPPYHPPINYKQIIAILVFISSTASVYFTLKKRSSVFNYIIVGLLLIMASRSMRHFPLLMVIWLVLIAPYYIQAITDRFKPTFPRPIVAVTTLSLLLLIIYALVSTKFNNNPFNSYCNTYPCGAISFLKQHKEYDSRIFNNYDFGGYMIGVAPEIPLFIDGRLSQYPFKGHSILEEYLLFYRKDLVRKKLEEHDIRTVIYKKPKPPSQPNWFEYYILGMSKNNSTEQSFLAYLSTSTNWQRIFEDNVSLIYVKK